MFESVWTVFDTTTMVDITSSAVHAGLQHPVRRRRLRHARLLHAPGHRRHDPPRTRRPVPSSARAGEVDPRIVRRLTLLATALEITDQLCHRDRPRRRHQHGADGRPHRPARRRARQLNVAAPGAGAIITIFLAGLAIGAAVIVWISLLVRKALLLIAIVFAPIALAGSSWDHTRGWVSKWASFVIALILSKVVLVVIFLLATAQVSAPIDADLQSVSEPIAGVVLMLIAGFAPYLTYKAISFMGFDMYHAMSAEQEAKSRSTGRCRSRSADVPAAAPRRCSTAMARRVPGPVLRAVPTPSRRPRPAAMQPAAGIGSRHVRYHVGWRECRCERRSRRCRRRRRGREGSRGRGTAAGQLRRRQRWTAVRRSTDGLRAVEQQSCSAR